jgi:hypothetical protein
MDDQNEREERPLTDEQESVVEEICAEHDFPLRGAVMRREILALTPRTLADLPTSERMGVIADALEDRGFQYVTFTVPEGPPEDGEGEEA